MVVALSTQACITAAVQLIQARHPSYSSARCWHMLFAKYCELWQQQHALLALWANAGGWVGAVRAGGMLTVLRGVTPAEALGQETIPSVLKQVMEVRHGNGRLCADADTQQLAWQHEPCCALQEDADAPRCRKRGLVTMQNSESITRAQ